MTYSKFYAQYRTIDYFGRRDMYQFWKLGSATENYIPQSFIIFYNTDNSWGLWWLIFVAK